MCQCRLGVEFTVVYPRRHLFFFHAWCQPHPEEILPRSSFLFVPPSFLKRRLTGLPCSLFGHSYIWVLLAAKIVHKNACKPICSDFILGVVAIFTSACLSLRAITLFSRAGNPVRPSDTHPLEGWPGRIDQTDFDLSPLSFFFLTQPPPLGKGGGAEGNELWHFTVNRSTAELGYVYHAAKSVASQITFSSLLWPVRYIPVKFSAPIPHNQHE